jgi:hypothetical protein
MIRTTTPVLFAVLLAPLALTLTSCSSNDATARVSVSTTTGTSGGSQPLVTGGSIALSAAQVTVSDIKLAVAGTPCGDENEMEDALRMNTDSRDMGDDSSHDGEHDGDHDGDHEDNDQQHDGCEQIRVAPLTVNLPLDASTSLVLDALVPPGTYVGVHAKIEAAKVSGTFTDTAGAAHPFTFMSNGKSVLEIHLPTPVTVGPGTSNITVMVDVASWFKTASGVVLDPTSDANASAINRNILRSFRAFGDRDHDGEDDHDEHDDDDHHEKHDSSSTPI